MTEPKLMVEPQGHHERFLTKHSRRLVEVILCKAPQNSIRVFLGPVRSPTGQILPPPLKQLATAEHADGVWICLPLRRPVITEAAAIAEARLFAQQHIDAAA